MEERGLGFDLAGERHAAGVADRHARGVFYTPEPLVRFLWSLIEEHPTTALDPACGSGRLLHEARRRGARVVGFDLDAEALAIARRALPDADLRCVDALSADADLPPVDLLVANPPYGRRAPDDHIRDVVAPFAFPRVWHDVVPLAERNRGKLVEHAAWFVALAHHRVRPGGTIALLTTNSWLSIPTWRYLRRWVLERWTLRYLVDFNRPSDRRSVFAPHAGVAASILVATRSPPPPDHVVRVLDLSALETIRARFEALGRCVWSPPARDVRDLRSFEPVAPAWMEVPQGDFLAQPDHRLRRPTSRARLLDGGVTLSELGSTHPGVDPGDLKHLVAPDAAKLRAVLEPVLRGELRGLTPTAAGWIAKHAPMPFDPARVVPFLYQKDLERFGWRRLHVTYLDRRVLWRARCSEGGPSPILATPKLIVLERRERGEVVAAVAEQLVVPQHGGRLLYVTGLSSDILHALCAILNAPQYQVYYREAGQGDKNLRVPDPRALAPDTLAALADCSRRGGSRCAALGTVLDRSLRR